MATPASTGGWAVALIGAGAVIVAAVIGILPQFVNDDDPARRPSPTEGPSESPATISGSQSSNPPPNPTSDTTRAVTDVTGLNLSQAINRLKADGFEYWPEHEKSATVPLGDVIRTEPPANTQVVKGTRVTLVLSWGSK